MLVWLSHCMPYVAVAVAVAVSISVHLVNRPNESCSCLTYSLNCSCTPHIEWAGVCVCVRANQLTLFCLCLCLAYVYGCVVCPYRVARIMHFSLSADMSNTLSKREYRHSPFIWTQWQSNGWPFASSLVLPVFRTQFDWSVYVCRVDRCVSYRVVHLYV